MEEKEWGGVEDQLDSSLLSTDSDRMISYLLGLDND